MKCALTKLAVNRLEVTATELNDMLDYCEATCENYYSCDIVAQMNDSLVEYERSLL
mgnify:CR=1 FL=1